MLQSFHGVLFSQKLVSFDVTHFASGTLNWNLGLNITRHHHQIFAKGNPQQKYHFRLVNVSCQTGFWAPVKFDTRGWTLTGNRSFSRPTDRWSVLPNIGGRNELANGRNAWANLWNDRPLRPHDFSHRVTLELHRVAMFEPRIWLSSEFISIHGYSAGFPVNILLQPYAILFKCCHLGPPLCPCYSLLGLWLSLTFTSCVHLCSSVASLATLGGMVSLGDWLNVAKPWSSCAFLWFASYGFSPVFVSLYPLVI
jgi:hypothetical protein